MEFNQKHLNKQQTELRQVMTSFEDHEKTLQLFLRQHAMLHSRKMSQTEPWSYEDEILVGMSKKAICLIPPGYEHSVAWCIFHIARIEDVAMNILVAGSEQVLYQGDWLGQMKISFFDTANEMDQEAILRLSTEIDIEALRAYRVAVGRRTREIVQPLQPEDLKQKVDPNRVHQVMETGALVEEAREIADYWSKRTIAGLLLMPATRHSLVHLNEALRLKQRA